MLNVTKDENGKLPLWIVPFRAIEAVADIMAFGANKYGKDSWKKNEPEVYINALLRHLAKIQAGY